MFAGFEVVQGVVTRVVITSLRKFIETRCIFLETSVIA